MNRSVLSITLGLMLLILGVSSAYGAVTVTTSCGEGGTGVGSKTTFNVPTDGELKSAATLLLGGGVGLSQTISGSGDLEDSRWVQNKKGSYAEEGVKITGSASYDYTYFLYPGEYGGWSGSDVSAGSSLNVNNAYYINAYARAHNSKGYSSEGSIQISDPAKGASLLGFNNEASANDKKVTITQSANGVIGVVDASALVKDISGKESKSDVSFIGAYSLGQFASVEKSTIQSWQEMNGIGWFEGATTYAKDGKGKEAITKEDGSFSATISKNILSASIGASGPQASQDISSEYQPISFSTGTYDQKVTGTFSTLAKYGDGRESEADIKTAHTEKYTNMQSASIDKSTAEAANSAILIIGVADPSVSVKDKNGKEANSLSSFIGAYSLDQTAWLGKSVVQSSQDTKGEGWFTGATTIARDGKGKEAITNEDGSFSGKLIKNMLSASIATSGPKADQDISAEYQPISYQTGTYDQKVAGIFSTSAKYGDGRVVEADVNAAHCEHFANIQSAFIDRSTAKSVNSAVNIIGVAIPSVSAKDKSGKEANSVSSFTGVYSIDQSASFDKSTIQSNQDMNGVGFFAGATTNAKDGKGKVAITMEDGSFSGTISKNKLSASIAASGPKADQDISAEYHPISYQTGTYDQKVTGMFGISVNYGDGRVAEAKVDTAHCEKFTNMESASIGKYTSKAANSADLIIGVANPSVMVNDKNGRGASSLASFTGVYSVGQSASLDKSIAQSSLDMAGVGYFAGARTVATDGKDKAAEAKQEGGISGSMAVDKQSTSVGSKAEAIQDAIFEYMPVSYQTGTYDMSSMTFSAYAKTKGKLDPVTEVKNNVYTPYQIWQEVQAP